MYVLHCVCGGQGDRERGEETEGWRERKEGDREGGDKI